jgi:hypothetical protein
MAVDWDFISGPGIEGESTHKTGYVPPTALSSKLGSGFTVGSLDVGQHSEEEIRSILQQYANIQAGGGPGSDIVGSIRADLLKKLTPYVKEGRSGSIWGKYGSQEGYDMMAKTEKFQPEDIEYIMAAKRSNFENKLSGRKDWSGLDKKSQTILASVGWQYGLNSPEFDRLWNKRPGVKGGSKKEMANYLRGLDDYKPRRNLEADYIDPLPLPVKETLNVDKEKEIF